MGLTVQKGNKKPQKTIIQDFTFVAPDRTRKDVGILRYAIERAESVYVPNRYKLLDLYHDIVTIDGHLAGIIQKRTDAVKNKGIKFIDNSGKRVDKFDDLINTEKFKRLVELIMERKYWGVSGVEFLIGDKFDFNEIDRKHINVEHECIVKSQFETEGTSLDTLPFVWVLGNKYELGRLLQCSMYALYKRSGFGDFAQYVEIFGQPVRIIYYDAYDSKTKDELHKILTESGSSLAMMIPKQAKFEMLDGKTSNGNGDLQEKLIKVCNDEMSVAILGNTESTTSSDSSGYAQSLVHASEQLEITKSDIDYVQASLNNEQFINILKSYGFPVDNGHFEFEQELDLNNLQIRLNIDKELALHVPIDDDYWYTTYGVPKPQNYDELKAKKEAQQNAAIEAQNNNPDANQQGDAPPDKKTVTVKKKTENLASRLATFFFGSNEVIDLADYYGVENLPSSVGHGSVNNLSDDSFESIYDSIAHDLLESKLQTGDIPLELYFETAKRLFAAIDSGLGESPFNYDDSRNILKTYLTRNIYQFSAAKSLTELIEFRDLMYDKNTGEIRPYTEFRKLIAEKGKLFNDAWLNTEYSTAKQSAIMAHKWDTLNSEYLQFSTVGDDRVRPAHAALDGKTYPKNHPFWLRAYPPLDWKCRCTVIPGVPDRYVPADSIPDEKYVKNLVKGTIFDNNVGITRIVFNQEHPYYENLSTGKLKALDFKNYGLPTIEKAQLKKGVKPVAKLESKEQFNEFWNNHTNHAHGIVLADPLGQNILFPDNDLLKKKNANQNFKQHILDHKEDVNRYKLLPNIKEIIKSPDEVWSVVNKQYPKSPVTNHYIKFFEGNTLVILVDNNEAKSIFYYTESGFSTRKGILLYRK